MGSVNATGQKIEREKVKVKRAKFVQKETIPGSDQNFVLW